MELKDKIEQIEERLKDWDRKIKTLNADILNNPGTMASNRKQAKKSMISMCLRDIRDILKIEE